MLLIYGAILIKIFTKPLEILPYNFYIPEISYTQVKVSNLGLKYKIKRQGGYL